MRQGVNRRHTFVLVFKLHEAKAFAAVGGVVDDGLGRENATVPGVWGNKYPRERLTAGTALRVSSQSFRQTVRGCTGSCGRVALCRRTFGGLMRPVGRIVTRV